MTDKPAKKRGQGRTKKEAVKLAARRAEVFAMWMKGHRQCEIARALAMSNQLVSLDILTALAEWREQHRGSIAEMAEHELRRLHKVELMAEQDYELSRRDEKGKRQKGDPAFLRVMLECSEQRRKLGGIDQPARSEVKTTSDVNFRTFKTRDEMKEEVHLQLQRFRERAALPSTN